MKISKKHALDVLDKKMQALSEFVDGENIAVGFSYDRPVGDGFLHMDSSEKINVGVGLCGLSSDAFGRIDFDVFCDMLLSFNHEARHVEQITILYKSDEFLSMAKDHLVSWYNPRWYFTNYGDMLHEIDANIEGIRATRDYFRETYPDYDVDRALCDILFERQSEGTHSWFTEEHKRFDSVDEMLKSMEMHKQRVSEYRSHYTYSRLLKNQTPDLMETYLNRTDMWDSWSYLDGLGQRDCMAVVCIKSHPEDAKYFPKAYMSVGRELPDIQSGCSVENDFNITL